MGVSTDAILVFGIPLEEEAIPRFDEDGYYAEDENRPDLTPDAANYPSWMVMMGCDLDGVDVVTHCSDQFPMYIVAVTGTKIWTWRGDPKLVKPQELADPSEDRVQQLRAFCDRYSLQTVGEPGWYLASYWG